MMRYVCVPEEYTNLQKAKQHFTLLDVRYI